MKKIANKTYQMKKIEKQRGGELEEILRTLYVDRELSVTEMSKLLGISYVTTLNWLQKAGIYSRKLKVDD